MKLILKIAIFISLALAMPIASASVFQDFVDSVGSAMPSSNERVSYSALDGMYVGSMIGFSRLRSNVKAIPTLIAGDVREFNLSTTESSKMLDFGYGTHSGQFYLGTEIEHHYDHEVNEGEIDIDGSTHILREVTVDQLLSLDFLPGYFVSNNFVLFMHLGVAYVRQTFVERRVSSTPGFIVKNVERSASYRFGVGGIYVLNSNLRARFEWIHTRFPGHNFVNEAFSDQEYQIRSNTDQFMIGLSYRLPLYDHLGDGKLPLPAFSS